MAGVPARSGVVGEGMRLNRRDFLKAFGVVVGGFVAWSRGVYRTQGEILFTNNQAGDSGVVGTITNILTDQPVAGASVSISGYSPVSSDSTGRYTLPVPPGLYEVKVKAPGFIDMSRVYQEVQAASFLTVDFALIPLNPSAEENQVIYQKLIAAPESSPQEPSPVSEPPHQLDVNPTVTVPSTINVLINGTTVTMALDDYVKGVVPAEMPASWPTEALKAQAVAARTYAVAYTQSGKAICTTSTCQAYTDARYANTNAAVDATSGQVVTYNGNIVSTLYFSS